ncbi:LysR substrate-binding domain-containing protein [Motiliproteus sp.]|uniref:LysR substrate-binding domain-containing protein n=1 Tax=Motiliproteus sp. TaxID=1898955 RepID=UPI003BA94C29
MYSPITLDALRALDAIDRRGSFAAAADELHRVPSALSYTISKLEEDLELELFDRRRRKAELTPVGRLVLEQGRRILLATEELTALAKQAAGGWEVELRIAVDSVFGCESIYPLVEAFQRLQPRTEVRLMEEVLAGSWDALDSERCDLVIGVEEEPPGQGFATQALGQVAFDFVVASDHPLATMPQPLSLATVQAYPTLVVADSSRSLPVKSTGLLDGRSRVVLPSIADKIEAQCLGMGVGYLPRHRIQQPLQQGRLKVLELDQQRPPQTMYLAWRKSNKGKGLHWFIEQLKAARVDLQQGLVMS